MSAGSHCARMQLRCMSRHKQRLAAAIIKALSAAAAAAWPSPWSARCSWEAESSCLCGACWLRRPTEWPSSWAGSRRAQRCAQPAEPLQPAALRLCWVRLGALAVLGVCSVVPVLRGDQAASCSCHV